MVLQAAGGDEELSRSDLKKAILVNEENLEKMK